MSAKIFQHFQIYVWRSLIRVDWFIRLTRVYRQRRQEKEMKKTNYDICRADMTFIRKSHRSFSLIQKEKTKQKWLSWAFYKFHTFLRWLCTLATPICHGCFSSLAVTYLWIFKFLNFLVFIPFHSTHRRDALYQGIFHRHRRTIFAVGSFLRMLRSRNSQYNTIRSNSEADEDTR